MKHELQAIRDGINKFTKTMNDAVQELQSTFDEAATQPEEKKGRWRPDKDTCYYHVSDVGTILSTYNTRPGYAYRIATGNCFPAEAEAEQYNQRQLATQRVKDRIREAGGGQFVVGAGNYYVCCNSGTGKLETVYYMNVIHQDTCFYIQNNAALNTLLLDEGFRRDYKIMLGVE